jgi:hypothetical protein
LTYSTFDIDDIMSWNPCDEWNREIVVEVLGEEWSGTVIDILNSSLASDGKLWVAIMCGDLTDAVLEEFSESCKEHSSVPDRRYKETVGESWKASIGKEISKAQEKAFAYVHYSSLFFIDNSDNRPLPLSEEDLAIKRIERIAKKEFEIDWQATKLFEILSALQ